MKEKKHDHLNWYRKGTWQNPLSVHDKNTHETGIEGNFLSLMKVVFKKPRVKNIQTTKKPYHIQWLKTQNFSLKVREKTRIQTYNISIQRNTENSAKAINQEK